MILENKIKYRMIDNRYLADALAFLGFTFRKFGVGKQTKYSFEDTVELTQTIGKLLTIKKELGR